LAAYQVFFESLTAAQKRFLIDNGEHAVNKLAAQNADMDVRYDDSRTREEA